MRIHRLIAVLAIASQAVARHSKQCGSAPVYMFSPMKDHESGEGMQLQKTPHHKEVPFLNTDQSQLFFADAAGTSKLYEVSSEDSKALSQVLSDCSSSNNHPFAEGHDSTVIIVISGVNEPLFDDNIMPSFKIDKSPSKDFFAQLFDKISEEVETITGKVVDKVSDGLAVISDLISSGSSNVRRQLVDVTLDGFDSELPAHRKFLKDIASLRSLSFNVLEDDVALLRLDSLSGLKQKDYDQALTTIKQTLDDLVDMAHSFRLAVVALPSDTCSCRLSGVANGHKSHKSPIHASAPTNPNGKAAYKRSIGVRTPDFKTNQFSSLDKCQKTTDFCSGHGSCQLVKSSITPAYSCLCSKTFDSDKKKTTYWAGNACQKKDVSVEVQLFFWTALFIILGFGWAISLLFTIGNDPLPGVLNVGKKSS